MNMISSNYGKFFLLLYYGELCTHIWYTPLLLQYGYDFGQLWKIFCTSMLLGTVYTHLVHTVPLTIWVWFLQIMENFLYFYTTGNAVHTFGTHRSSYNMGMISANHGKFFVLLYYGERCTHIWYTPFLLQYGYDFGQLWKIFCTSILRGTVFTHLVHTVPLTIWVWFRPIMENFLYFYTTGNGVHTFGTHRSSYNIGMISANYGKFFVLLYYGERCTHIWYTPFLLQYGYDYGQLWKIFCTSITRGTVYTHLVHTVPVTIWVWFRPIMENFLYFYTTGNGVHTFGTHRSSYNMGMISANYGKFFVLLYYGERCTHILYTPFLLQYGYDFFQLWKIFCTSILRGTVYTHLVHTVPLTIWVWFRPIMENFLYFYTTGNGVHTFGTHRSSYNMGMISANYGKFFVLLYYGERCTHIWYTPFLLQYLYDFCQLWKILCTSMLLGTVYTHLVHTVPLTIWIWFLLIMENFLYFYTTGNAVHTFGTHRSYYNMGMISANYGKFFLRLYYGERCTHIWYTPFLLQYGYDFGQLWKIFCTSILRGTVYTHFVHTVPLTIWVWFPPIMDNFMYLHSTGNGVHTFGTHRSSYNMGMITANYGKFFVLL